MGVEVALATAALTSAGASVFGGMAARDAAKAEASALETQAAVASQEATREAEQKADEVRRFRSTQKLAFLKNGVTLTGSPLLVLEETRKLGQEEVDSILKRGAAQSNVINQQAKAMRNKGRAALIGGITQAGSSLLSGASAFNK